MDFNSERLNAALDQLALRIHVIQGLLRAGAHTLSQQELSEWSAAVEEHVALYHAMQITIYTPHIDGTVH